MKNRLPYAKANSVDEYFSLPKKERQKFGLYLYPPALPVDLKNTSQWDIFSSKIRKEYPIQGFIREWLLDLDNPCYFYIWKITQFIKTIKLSILNFCNPTHFRFRKVYPRHQWNDLSEVITDINFALILDFWYGEMHPESVVDWESDEKHKNFFDWIKQTVHVIENEIPEILGQIDAEFKKEKIDWKLINKMEKEIEKIENKILIKLIEYKKFFWT